MKIKFKYILFISLIQYVKGNTKLIADSRDKEEQKFHIIADIVVHNLKYNGWNNILFMGCHPNSLYHSLKSLPITFSVTDIDSYDVQIENVVPYHSNIIIMSCSDIEEFEKAMRKIITLPYWHPLANIILYYHDSYDRETIAKLFFIYWYYKAINVIIIQYDEIEKNIIISYFNPYISDNFKLDNIYGCWTAKKTGIQIGNFKKSFICHKQCSNVTSYSKLRANHLGTCIGFNTEIIPYVNWETIQYLNLFEDKTKNLHGFTFYAYTVEVLPFLQLIEHENGTYTYHRRDGMIWNTMAKLLNFKIDIAPAIQSLKQKFDFEVNIRQVFSFTQRKADLILFPLYQFDLIIAEIDYTVPFVDSGVCILSQRAGFETIVFDVNLVEKNISIIIEFLICFVCTWFVFFIYNTEQSGKPSLDQAGKDLTNAFKIVLSVSLHNPPKRGSFRIFLTISIWSFFVINFSTQAAIISLFSIHKKNKEVNTFDDIIKKGYKIEGMATPDVVLPDTEEKFRIINSRMKPVPDLFGCVKHMENDSRRFCMIDCAVGRYLARNMLNKKGEQFLHLATNARIHSHYLNMILHKNSPLTENFNRYVITLFEAGLVKKWMEYRYFDVREEATIKALGMEDLGGIFECYSFLLGISFLIFLCELFLRFIYWIKCKCFKYGKDLKKVSLNLFTLKEELSKIFKFGNEKVTDMSTQTV